MSGKTVTELAQLAFDAYWGSPALGEEPPSPLERASAGIRQAWENSAAAVAAAVVNPAAEDFDAAAGTPEIAPVRYALVEQMGHRSTTGAVREITFLGKQMLEVTDLRDGSVHLVAPESLYEVTWLAESDARARAKPWTAVALPAACPSPWDDEDDEDDLAAEPAEAGAAQ